MTLLKPASSLKGIYSPIDPELKEFSSLLKKELASTDNLIRDIHDHLLKMSGKFLRPALAILSSRVENTRPADAVRLAVAIELIHTATLVHDDIIDDSELRRNQPTIYSKWGREISIVSGDYLYAKAFVLLADLKDVWVSQAFAQCAHVMCEGEMKQIEKRTHFLMGEEEYLKIIHQKTAALFQAACMGGGYYAGASHKDIEALGRYGYSLGMAFQIVDDCLDLVGDTESLGKTAGLDIYKNDVTLPLLYLFRELGETDRAALLSGKDGASGDRAGRIKKLVQEKRSVEKAMDRARGFIREGLEGLSGLKESPYKESLSQLAAYCVDRVR